MEDEYPEVLKWRGRQFYWIRVLHTPKMVRPEIGDKIRFFGSQGGKLTVERFFEIVELHGCFDDGIWHRHKPSEKDLCASCY